MEGTSILLFGLTVLFLAIVLGMNLYNTWFFQVRSEGFQDVQAQPIQESPLAPRIRAILDPMATPYAKDLCAVYSTIRTTMQKNIKADKGVDDKEAIQQVDADLLTKIPGGALPCPLLQYPRAGSTDLQWLHWLQGIPKDFGARVVFMADYAKTFLGETKQQLEAALSGKPLEAFQDICTPDVADTRRMEAAKKQTSNCILPENADPKTIANQVDSLLKQLVKEKDSILKAKNINPSQDIGPWIASAKQSAAWLDETAKRAESGDLINDVKISE